MILIDVLGQAHCVSLSIPVAHESAIAPGMENFLSPGTTGAWPVESYCQRWTPMDTQNMPKQHVCRCLQCCTFFLARRFETATTVRRTTTWWFEIGVRWCYFPSYLGNFDHGFLHLSVGDGPTTSQGCCKLRGPVVCGICAGTLGAELPPRKPLDDMLTVSRYETMEISWKYPVDICRLQREVPGSRPQIRNPPALALRYYSCTVYKHFTRNRFQSESSGCQGRPCFPHEPMS